MTDIHESSMTTYAAVIEGDDDEKLRNVLVADVEFSPVGKIKRIYI